MDTELSTLKSEEQKLETRKELLWQETLLDAYKRYQAKASLTEQDGGFDFRPMSPQSDRWSGLGSGETTPTGPTHPDSMLGPRVILPPRPEGSSEQRFILVRNDPDPSQSQPGTSAGSMGPPPPRS